MPTRDEVYQKIGEVAEAAQLLESELGTMLFTRAIEEDLIKNEDALRAATPGMLRLSEARGRLPGTHKATPPKQLHRLPAG